MSLGGVNLADFRVKRFEGLPVEASYHYPFGVFLAVDEVESGDFWVAGGFRLLGHD